VQLRHVDKPRYLWIDQICIQQQSLSERIYRSWEATARVWQLQTYSPTGEALWDAYWQTMLFGANGFDLQDRECVRTEFNNFYDVNRNPSLLAERFKLHWSKHLFAIYWMIRLVLMFRK
jgi:hypothetical protein